MAKREVGTVKWFNDKKGFGFISREGGEDLFVHFNEIQSDGGFKTLKENAKVEFEVIKTEKGEAAAKVKSI